MLKVDNFLVRVLLPGDREGLHQALKVGPKPLVEFRTLGNHLTSSYYVETLRCIRVSACFSKEATPNRPSPA